MTPTPFAPLTDLPLPGGGTDPLRLASLDTSPYYVRGGA